MIRILTILFFLIFLHSTIYSQTAGQFIRAGDMSFKRADYISAISYYTSALRQGADEVEYGYKLADSYRLFHNYVQAEKFYKNTILNDSENKFPLASFWLSMVLKNQMRYSEAENYLHQFVQNTSGVETYYREKALIELDAVKKSPQVINDSLDIEIKGLGSNVNSRFSEFAPFAENENKIYLSSIRYLTRNTIENGEKFYISKILTSEKRNDWNRPRLLSANINSDNEHTSNASVSNDGEIMFFTRCNAGFPADVKCRLLYSRLKNYRWQKPVELPEHINVKNKTTTQPSVSNTNDGSYIIYFSSDRDGGLGKSDIWYTIMDSAGNFSAPVNAGNKINSPGDEYSPFYHDSTGTLYFSSDYHAGIGGFDIFKSKGSKNIWETPVNAGYPINSSYDDLYFNLFSGDTSAGFLASNRPGSETVSGDACCYDIYSFNLIEKKDTITKRDTLISSATRDSLSLNNSEDTTSLSPETKTAVEQLKSFLPLELYFHNDEPDPKTTKTSTLLTYEETFNQYINLKDLYKKNYTHGLTDTDALRAEASIIRFFEDEVESGMQKLNQFSGILLQRLNAGDSFTLKLKGYTSPLATTEYNSNLAHRRISSLINYFQNYDNGALQKFLSSDSGDVKLVLIEEPLGETTAPSHISDDLHDKRKSVYSPEAASERRIEIIAVDIQ